MWFVIILCAIVIVYLLIKVRELEDKIIALERGRPYGK
jgi:hypothetical protein